MIDGLSVDANSVIELIRKGSSSTVASRDPERFSCRYLRSESY
jgi:hypothetical protein